MNKISQKQAVEGLLNVINHTHYDNLGNVKTEGVVEVYKHLGSSVRILLKNGQEIVYQVKVIG